MTGRDPLPTFRYHPDPIGTGSIVESDEECECCARRRGYRYEGPVYAVVEIEIVCPWCIDDGSAHENLGCEFTDSAGVGDHGSWSPVPDAIAEHVTTRTPGFSGWQQERWWTCCNDAAAFLGRAGRRELSELGPPAVEAIRLECGLEGAEWQDYFQALEKDGSPTAYVFECLHCGALGGYSDCD
jgi:hypothetical protein